MGTSYSIGECGTFANPNGAICRYYITIKVGNHTITLFIINTYYQTVEHYSPPCEPGHILSFQSFKEHLKEKYGICSTELLFSNDETARQIAKFLHKE